MSVVPIVLEQVCHSFGEGELRTQVLFDIDAEVKEGEIVLLTGPSGSGKTTLLTLVGALRSTQQGSLCLLGHELRGASPGLLVKARRSIGFIFQSHNLIDSLTARENVQMALQLGGRAGPRSRRSRATELLESVGLGEFAHQLPRRLSGGQRQRVAIARALASHPRIILADEPTASLDRDTGREVIELIQELARSDGVSVLLVTHDNRILDVADRILHLEDGRLSSFTEAVTANTENLMAGLARTTRRGEIAAQVEKLSDDGFDHLLQSFTTETSRFLDVVRLSQSDAYESMLEQVLEVFTRKVGQIVDAERATLYLVDPQEGELWSKYAGSDGDDPLEIRIPIGVGIAGAVAATGEPINVADAYEDPRFDSSTDRETGFRTEAILCAPIRGEDGSVIAVAQMLNRRDGGTFGVREEQEVSAFVDSMGVILESWQVMSRNRRR